MKHQYLLVVVELGYSAGSGPQTPVVAKLSPVVDQSCINIKTNHKQHVSKERKDICLLVYL